MAFGVGAVDAFAFDLELHLREGGHDDEDHGSHGCAGVDVPAAEVQDAQVHLLRPESVGQGKHVGSGAAEAIEGGDYQGVAFMERVEGFVELGPPRMGTADAVVDVKVIAADIGGE
ncbi:hypothetical protein ASH00_02765 [Arthrobacter sp. Soil782]|nr:hypothetical protein ASH00_02765 [Arthrobacter sp. Soil782]